MDHRFMLVAAVVIAVAFTVNVDGSSEEGGFPPSPIICTDNPTCRALLRRAPITCEEATPLCDNHGECPGMPDHECCVQPCSGCGLDPNGAETDSCLTCRRVCVPTTSCSDEDDCVEGSGSGSSGNVSGDQEGGS